MFQHEGKLSERSFSPLGKERNLSQELNSFVLYFLLDLSNDFIVRKLVYHGKVALCYAEHCSTSWFVIE